MNKLIDSYKKNEIIAPLPKWVEEGPPVTEKLYKATINLVKKIEDIINSKQKGLTVKDRTLNFSKIASKANVSNTNLRKDRQPDLIKYIESENLRLNQIWLNLHKHPKSGKRSSKAELLKQKQSYEKRIKELEELNLKAYFNEALKSEFIEDQHNQIQKYNQLNDDYHEALRTIANLRKQNQDLMKLIK